MTPVQMRKALVTGASGFVGSELTAQLIARGITVIAATRHRPREGPEWLPYELPGTIDVAALEGVDVVFHLAGVAHALSAGAVAADQYDLVNHRGTVELADVARRAGVRRFVFVSSVKAQGEPGQDPVSERSRSMPADPYGLSKRLAEDALLLPGSGSMEVVVARPTLVYGPGVKGNLAVLTQAILNGSPPPLPDVGNRRSLIGNRDLARALIFLAEHPDAAGRSFTLTDGAVYSTERLTNALAVAAGVRARPRFRVPATALRAGGAVGSWLERRVGRQMPLSREKVQRLLGNAEYEGAAIRQLGFKPEQTFEDVAADIVRSMQPATAGTEAAS